MPSAWTQRTAATRFRGKQPSRPRPPAAKADHSKIPPPPVARSDGQPSKWWWSGGHPQQRRPWTRPLGALNTPNRQDHRERFRPRTETPPITQGPEAVAEQGHGRSRARPHAREPVSPIEHPGGWRFMGQENPARVAGHGGTETGQGRNRPELAPQHQLHPEASEHHGPAACRQPIGPVQ